MTNDQRQRALSGLAKRRAICDFISSEAYLHPVKRTLGAIDLFLRRAYRAGDGMLGLVQDILGRRTWMRDLALVAERRLSARQPASNLWLR
jgi:hypothetical protein